MTKIKFLLPILAVVALLTGCGTFWGNKPITPERVQAITQSAVWTTATVWTLNRPETIPKFRHALNGLNSLVQREQWSMSAITEALSGSGADVFSGDEAKIWLTGANLILVTSVGEKVDLSQVAYVEAFARGAQGGLQLALQGQ